MPTVILCLCFTLEKRNFSARWKLFFALKFRLQSFKSWNKRKQCSLNRKCTHLTPIKRKVLFHEERLYLCVNKTEWETCLEKMKVYVQWRQITGSSYGFSAVGRRCVQVLPVVLCIILHLTVLPWPKHTHTHDICNTINQIPEAAALPPSPHRSIYFVLSLKAIHAREVILTGIYTISMPVLHP
jgi:hypothetical protein